MTMRLLVYVFGLLGAALLFRFLRSTRTRQIILLIGSYAFYATWGPWFLAILLVSSLVNFAFGKQLRRSPTLPWLWTGIIFNMALLGFFKYLPGIAEQIGGRETTLVQVVLPVGMSFWTFQALSYLFDLYREEELDPSLLEFSVYMSLAPTVLSGPICRLSAILPQLRYTEQPRRNDMYLGTQRIWLGALMMALAQLLGSGIRPGDGINAGFDVTGSLNALDVWLLAIGYGFQLFFDFSGYSHVAIGTACLLGIHLSENFDRPYLSTSPSAFWTRWHMSLSFWIRDYLFLPLATVRRGTWWRHAALLLSMIVFGLWHKGTLLFILWGVYHGILLVVHRQWQLLQRRFDFRWEGTVQDAVAWLVTIMIMSLGWILFRARDLKQASGMFGSLLDLESYGTPALPIDLYWLTASLILSYFVLMALPASWADQAPILSWMPIELRYTCYAVTLYLVVFRAVQPQAFIYSQF